MSLKGKRAFITGSFQGIGLGIATSLAAEGAAIVLHGLADEATIAAAEKAVLAAGAAKVESHVSDLRDVKATEELIAKILANGVRVCLCRDERYMLTAQQPVHRRRGDDLGQSDSNQCL